MRIEWYLMILYPIIVLNGPLQGCSLGLYRNRRFYPFELREIMRQILFFWQVVPGIRALSGGTPRRQ